MAKRSTRVAHRSNPRDVSYFKGKGLDSYFTLTELSREVDRDPSWLRLLESQNRIPRAKRVVRGKLSVRLWSPAQVEEIKAILATLKPGRPRKK